LIGSIQAQETPTTTNEERREKTMALSECVRTILEQLGGNRALVVSGLRIKSATEESVTLQVPPTKSGPSRLTITYDAGEDTYTVQTFKGKDEHAKHEGIYCDVLQDTVEEETGLYLTLKPRR
jgi:hypothetical protein